MKVRNRTYLIEGGKIRWTRAKHRCYALRTTSGLLTDTDSKRGRCGCRLCVGANPGKVEAFRGSSRDVQCRAPTTVSVRLGTDLLRGRFDWAKRPISESLL